MKDPTLELLDDTYTRGRTVDIKERMKFGHMTAHTSNTVGRHYLSITMSEPRSRTEWSWQQTEMVFGKGKADETRVGIRLHARQVQQLKRFLERWLMCHREWMKGGK